jgi:hypothetical protein
MADGDAGNNYLQSIVNFGADDTSGGMTESEVNAFAAGAKGLRTMAESGGWAISEEGGTHFRSAVEQARDSLEMLSQRVRRLGEMPNLGNDEYAQDVGRHMLEVLDSDETSLVPAIQTFQDGLNDMHAAIDTAIRNFNNEDDAAMQRFASN